tara:strand:+ start:1264 stop:3501 length:2238 start_codon:yes stop_codon:yes gene_type:complete
MKQKKPIYFPQSHLMYEVVYNSSSALSKSSFDKVPDGPAVARLAGTYNPTAAVNVLQPTSKRGIEISKNFLNLDNHKIPFLTPEIRLYKIVGNKAIPIYMPVASDFSFDSDGLIKKDKVFSGAGVELQSLSITLAGKNPYDVTRKFLNASLNIRVENISIIFEEKEGFAPIADLFTVRSPLAQPLSQGAGNAGGGALQSGRNCHVGVTFGYASPDFYDESVFTAEEGTAIIQQQAAFNLFYAGHDLNLAPDGSATIAVKYTGYMKSLEDFYSDMSSNGSIKGDFAIKTSFAKDSQSISSNIMPAKEKKNGNNAADPEQNKDFSDVSKYFSEMLNSLYQKQKIYSTKMENLSLFFNKAAGRTNVQTSAPPGIPPGTAPSGANQAEEDIEVTQVSYFNFGDFLTEYFNVMVSHLGDGEEIIRAKRAKNEIKTDQEAKQALNKLVDFRAHLKNFSVITADCEILADTDQDTKITTRINIADIPISLDTLYTMVFDKLTSKGVGFYDMNAFLTNFCTELLQNSLLSNLKGGNILKESTIKSTLITGRQFKKKIFKGDIKVDDIPPSQGSFTFKNIGVTNNYFIFHQDPTSTTPVVGAGRAAEDALSGIFPIRPNKDKGLVKSVSFSKISQPAREAFLVVTAGDVYDELRIPHNATAKFVGNNLFLPGSMAFIDPSSLGFGHPGDTESAAQRLGIGGYYTVEQVQHDYSNGSIETTLSLKFNHFPDGLGGAGLTKSQAASIKQVQSITGV